MSAATNFPSAQSRGGPGLRRWAVAAVVGGVVLVHALLLGHWTSPGAPAAPAAPGALSTTVRTVVAVAPTAGPAAEPPAEPLATPPAAPPPPAALPRRGVPATAVVERAPAAEAPPAGAVEPVVAPSAALPAAPPASGPAVAAALPGPSASADVPPLYRAPLPPPFEAGFRLRRGALAGSATWRLAADAGRYELTLQTRVLGREVSHLRSEGQAGAWGLEPTRFVEGRRGRDQRAVNFQRDSGSSSGGGGRISFSATAVTLALPPGVQDRLGWLLQLSAIIDADPSLRERGAEVSMWVVGPRGDADIWTFVVVGSESAGTGAGALALRRDPRRAWDTEVRVWLDPAARHLPLRAAWRTQGPDAETGGGVELERESLVWR